MRLISKLQKSDKLKKILFIAIVVLLGIYVFCVPSFEKAALLFRLSIYGSMILLGVCSIVYCFLFDNLRLPKFSLLIPVFVIHAFIGTLLYSHEFGRWFSSVFLAGSFFAFLYAFKAIKKKETIFLTISVGFFLFSLYFIFYFRNEIISLSFLGAGSEERLGQPINNPNDIAAFAVVGFSVPLYLTLFWDKKVRFLFIIPVLTSLFVGLTTGSRTFLLILTIVVIVYLFFVFRKHKIIYLLSVISAIIIGIVFINLPFMVGIKERLIAAIQTIFGTAQKVDTSVLERTVMIDYGFYLGSKRLLFGYGAYGFASISGIGTYAHSNFSEMLCDFGIIGLILFYLPLVVLVVKAIMNKKIDKSFVITFFVYYFIVSFSNVIYYKKIFFLVFALMFYLVFIECLEYKKVPLVSKMDRVVFTCDSMGSGGAEKVIASLTSEMCNKGIEVTIIGIADRTTFGSFYELGGAKYITLKNRGGKRINSIKRVFLIREQLKKINPDIVISFLPNANIYTWLALIGTKTPYVCSERNNPAIDPKNRIIRFFKKISFHCSSGIVFQTKDAMNHFSGKIRNKSEIIKNPIKIKDFIEDKIHCRNKTVLAVGRLVEQKNYRCLLKAFEIFNKQKNNCYILRIYGDGPMKNELIDYCRDIQIQNYVFFIGNDPNWHSKEYNDAMFVLSSNYEGMPNALAEAMAIGIPSISTNCPSGGSRELINDGVNGYLVPVNDPDALASKMIELSNKPADIFVNENANMINEYSVESTTNKWIDFIKGLTKEVYE